MPQPLLFSPVALRDITLKRISSRLRARCSTRPMDAAQKLGVDRRFELVPPPHNYWLAKRAQSVPNIAPSTYRAGLGEPPSPERQA